MTKLPASLLPASPWTRRALLVATTTATAAALIVPAAVNTASAQTAAPMSAQEQQLYDAAKKEGEVTWYVAQFATNIADDIAKGFADRYPGVRPNVVRQTGQVIYTRLAMDLKSNSAQCDVFSPTDVSHLVELKAQGKLAKFVPENASKIRKEFQNADPDGFFHTNHFDSITLVYNPKTVPADKAPKKWADLVDPQWKGKIAVSHPGYSGWSGAWGVFMQKQLGKDAFKKLSAQDPLVSRSMADPVLVVAKGERAIGLSTVALGVNSKTNGNAVEVVYPSDGILVMASDSGVMANAPHPNAAKLFMNYLMSEEAGRILAGKYRFISIRPEVPTPAGFKAPGEVPTTMLKDKEMIDGIPPVIEDWRDALGG